MEVFAATLRRLADQSGGLAERDLPGPHASLPCPAGPAAAAADAFEAIVDGTSAGVPGGDLLGRPASRHEFGEFTVLRPLEAS